MELKFIGSTNNFVLKSSDTFRINLFKLTNSNDVLFKEVFDDNFKSSFGALSTRKLSQTPYLYLFITLHEYAALTEFYNESDALKKMNASFAFFIDTSWFIKDNASFIDVGYMVNSLSGGYFIDSRNSYNSNASGEYVPTEFDYDEILRLIDIYEKISQLKKNSFIQEEENKPFVNVTGKSTAASSPFNFVRHKNLNRFIKALTFLHSARTNSYLPMKLSFYIVILETLFGLRGDSDIANNIKKRVWLFIGNKFDSEDSVRKIIKDAYEVRSRFLHGDYIDGDMDKLKTISIRIDELIREIFLKVIYSEWEYFILTNSKPDKDKFIEYIQNLK